MSSSCDVEKSDCREGGSLTWRLLLFTRNFLEILWHTIYSLASFAIAKCILISFVFNLR